MERNEEKASKGVDRSLLFVCSRRTIMAENRNGGLLQLDEKYGRILINQIYNILGNESQLCEEVTDDEKRKYKST